MQAPPGGSLPGLEDCLLHEHDGAGSVSVAAYLAALEDAGGGAAAAGPDAFAPCPCPVEGCSQLLTSRSSYYLHLQQHDNNPGAATRVDRRLRGAGVGAAEPGVRGDQPGPSGGGADGGSGGSSGSGGGAGSGSGRDSGGGGGGGGGEADSDGFDRAPPDAEEAEAAAAAAEALLDGGGDGWFAETGWSTMAAELEQDFGREAAMQLLGSLVLEAAAAAGGDAGEGGEEAGWEDDDLGDEEGAAGAGSSSSGRLSALFYRDSLLQPLYDGSKASLLQTAHLLLSWKQRFNLKDEFMEEMCRAMAEFLLPQGNIMAPSLYMLTKVCGVPLPAEIEQHVCVNDCERFDPLPPSQYAAHRDQCCSKCGQRRFCERGSRLAPRKRFWHFGLPRALRHLFYNPAFTKHRGTARDVPGDIYKSELARRIDAQVTPPGGESFVFNAANSLIELCCDAGQMFSFRQHSTTVIGGRNVDVPITVRSKRDFVLPLVLIPGPREPKDMEPYLQLLLEELHTLGPGGPGLEVRPPGAAPFTHRVLVSGIVADSPAQRKLSRWLAHNAYRGCGWCWLQSLRSPDNVQFWGGYAAAAPAGKYTPDVPPKELRFAGDTGLTEQAQRRRARKVAATAAGGAAAAERAAQRLGCHGPSPIVEGLPYGTYDLFCLPIAHALLLGLVKDFLALIFSSGKRGEARPWWRLPSESRAIITGRASGVTCTDDFQRSYSCVCTARGHWVMEDYFHFVETWSLAIFSNEPGYGEVLADARLRDLWCHLRTAVLILLRPLDRDTHATAEEAAQAAAKHLFKYGRLAESELAGSARLLCKFNLHQLVCRLTPQAQVRGHSANYTEYWVENLVQLIKSATKYRSTTAPELVVTKTILTTWRLQELAQEHPDHTRGFDELCPGYRAAAMRGRNLDVVDGDAAQLLGSGRAPTRGERQRLLSSLRARLADSTWPSLGAGWSAAWVPEELQGALIYQHADQGGGGYTFKSAAYGRAFKRVSYYSVVQYTGDPAAGGGRAYYVAKIKWFAKVQPATPAAAAAAAAAMAEAAGQRRGKRRRAAQGGSSGSAAATVGRDPPAAIRVAVCDLYKASASSDWRGDGFNIPDTRRPWKTDVCLPLCELGQKVLAYFEARAANARSHAASFFPYHNLSRTVQL